MSKNFVYHKDRLSGEYRSRTDDLLRARQALQPTELIPLFNVVPGRLELPTSTLSVQRSNQLSYETLKRKKEDRIKHKQYSKKEIFQPHLPVRLPCYDLALVICFTLGSSFRLLTSGTTNFHGLTGGVYKARERIHRIIADIRLLAIPTSQSRVADSDPNWDQLYGFALCHQMASHCIDHCSTCVAQDIRAVMI